VKATAHVDVFGEVERKITIYKPSLEGRFLYALTHPIPTTFQAILVSFEMTPPNSLFT
jgi:hypothetical protein